MGVHEYTSEITTTISQTKAFKAFVLDSDTLIPKILPHAIQSIEILKGDGGPGSIKKFNLGEGCGLKYVKHKVEVLDKETFTYCYTIIEGGVIREPIEKIENEIKIEATLEGGSVLKSNTKYYTKDDYQLNQEELKVAKEKSLNLFKAIEGYVLANPDT